MNIIELCSLRANVHVISSGPRNLTFHSANKCIWKAKAAKNFNRTNLVMRKIPGASIFLERRQKKCPTSSLAAADQGMIDSLQISHY